LESGCKRKVNLNWLSLKEPNPVIAFIIVSPEVGNALVMRRENFIQTAISGVVFL